ncbi:hypothetical protein KAR91_48440 [Candidatus Pacearchaeota archaeon]|nr:hypothetical protein [Candidatus Pacearchaeota archaeon]
MGMVTDIKWECPGCGKENIAQTYDDFYYTNNYEPLPRKAVPSNAELKWNPPCEKCGEYRLIEPPVMLVEFPIGRVEE